MNDPDSVRSRRLVDAIQDGELRDLLADTEPDDDDVTIGAVRRAVASIDATVETERNRLQQVFTRANVTTATIRRDPLPRPLVIVRADVDPGDVDRAVAAAEAIGYRRLAPTGAGPWRAYRRLHGGCVLVDVDRDERRLELSWGSPLLARGVLARLMVPTSGDLEAVSLPERWWFGYIGVHLARLPMRLWQRRSEPRYLGPYLVTPSTLVAPLLRCADIRAGELLVDLGCGDGRILVEAAEIGCRAIGVETDADLVERARAAADRAGVTSRVQVVHGDATTADIGDADVVVMFLPVDTLRDLLPAVLDRMRPGARLVVHEQERLTVPVAPDHSVAICSSDGVTVAHRWDR
ncbi:MAG: methyltransferase domain-containing protein [Ilumatobacter sp.]|nr:methyltransferase domain-containing protein [Ilumatobacter sp.]